MQNDDATRKFFSNLTRNFLFSHIPSSSSLNKKKTCIFYAKLYRIMVRSLVLRPEVRIYKKKQESKNKRKRSRKKESFFS